MLAACGTQTDASPSDSQASASISSPTAASTPSATPAVSSNETGAVSPPPSPGAEPRLEIFSSAVNGLRLRAGPSTAAELVASRPGTDAGPITIDAGQTLAALEGPVASDGFDWYLVQPIIGRGFGQLGWAATPQVGDAWLVPGELECPPAPADLMASIAIAPAAALYCSGGGDLSLEGYVVTGFGCNVTGTFEPEWLAHPCANMSFISPAPLSERPTRQLFLHYPAPGVPNPTLSYSDEQLVRIVGHYDDPAAAGCVIEPDELDPNAPSYGASDPAADVAECRLRFVVTEVTPLP